MWAGHEACCRVLLSVSGQSIPSNTSWDPGPTSPCAKLTQGTRALNTRLHGGYSPAPRGQRYQTVTQTQSILEEIPTCVNKETEETQLPLNGITVIRLKETLVTGREINNAKKISIKCHKITNHTTELKPEWEVKSTRVSKRAEKQGQGWPAPQPNHRWDSTASTPLGGPGQLDLLLVGNTAFQATVWMN